MRHNHSKRPIKPVWLWLIATGVVSLALMGGMFFLWLSSRFNFMLLDVLADRSRPIMGSFARHRESGNSYFGWTLVYLGIGSVAFLLAILVIVLAVGIMKWSAVVGIPLMIFGILFLLAVLAAMIFIGTIMRDFALPIMYARGTSAMGALDQFLENDAFTFGGVFRYFLVILGLGLVFAILQGIISFLVVLGGTVVGAVTVISTWLLVKVAPFKVIPFLKIFIMIFEGFVAVALMVAAILAIGMIMLPAAIFLRVFALAYLTRLYPEYDLLKFLKEDAPETLFGPS